MTETYIRFIHCVIPELLIFQDAIFVLSGFVSAIIFVSRCLIDSHVS